MRAPPQAIEPEREVLGALLEWNDGYDQLIGQLTEADFYRSAHRVIFRAISKLVEAGKPVDVPLLADALETSGDLENVGGREYLVSLLDAPMNARNVRAYARPVRRTARLRAVLAIATEMYEAASSPGADADEAITGAADALYRLQDGAVSDDMRSLQEILTESIERIDTMYWKPEGAKFAGVPTGLIDLDRLVGGLEAGDLAVIGARPSMGKTALGTCIAENIARLGNGAVAIFSMEMTGAQIGLRYISANSAISMHELRTGTIKEEDWAVIVKATDRLYGLPIYIDDRAAVTVGYIRSRLRRLQRRVGKLALVVVDYLSLMDGDGESRDERVGSNAKGLKQIAKDFAVPVIALAQLNRALEQRNDKRPMLSDLRESGEIEQAGDVILFIYRDEVYNKATPHKGIAELIVAKQRNGPTETVYTTFIGKSMRFENVAPGWRPPSPKVEKPVRARDLSDFKNRAAGDDGDRAE